MRIFAGQRRACHIKLFGLANCCKNSGLLVGLANCSASERELAEERNAGNTHYLGTVLLEAHLLRSLHPPLARLVRVRLQARAHPAAAGPQPSSASAGRSCRGFTVAEIESDRLRPPRPVGVHPGPDGRIAGAVGLAAGRGRYRRCHADAHPRLLPAGPAMTRRATYTAVRALKRALAATAVWAALGAPAAGGEWREWCAGSSAGQAPTSGPSLGWHFYCDRQEVEAQRGRTGARPANAAFCRRIRNNRRRSASWSCASALEEARAEAILDPTPANVTAYLRLQQETLQRAASFSDAFRRTVWATPELDYTLRRPVGALAKQVWSDQRRRQDARRRAGPPRGALRADLPGPCRLRGVPGVRAAAPRVRDPPRSRRAGGLAQRRAAGRLARGGARTTGAPPGSASAADRGVPPRRCPALVLFDTKTLRRVIPVGFGVMAEDQMAETDLRPDGTGARQ